MQNENKLTKIVDDVIKENRRQLEDIKNMRKIYGNDLCLEKSQNSVNKFDQSFEESNKDYVNDKNEQEIDINDLFNLINNLNDKLNRKRNKLKTFKENYSNLVSENNDLKNKLNDNENFRLNLLEKLDTFEKDVKNNEIAYLERESLLIEKYQELEKENNFLKNAQGEEYVFQDENQITEERKNFKLNKENFKDENIKEIRYIDEKKQQYDCYLEENTKKEDLKGLRTQLDQIKSKLIKYEKMFEILLYFLKKVSEKDFHDLSLDTLDINGLQQILINLENILINQNPLNDIRLKSNEINEYSNFQILSERINEVNKENKLLKKKLQDLMISHQDNNFEKDTKLNTNFQSKDNWQIKYKTLEKRLHEIEKELILTRSINSQNSLVFNEIRNSNNLNEEAPYKDKFYPINRKSLKKLEIDSRNDLVNTNSISNDQTSKILSKLNEVENNLNINSCFLKSK